MAKLAAAFGSSHSVMLVATRENWISGFRENDHRLPFYDRSGASMSFEAVVKSAPPGADARVTPEAIGKRFDDTQRAMDRVRDEIASAQLDTLIIVGDDQYELFLDNVMPPLAIYYGPTIRNAKQKPVDNWYRHAQMQRLEETGDVDYPVDSELALHLIKALGQRDFDITSLKNLNEGQHEGHAYSFIHRRYLKGHVIPIVPVFLNTYNEPNPPTPRRCVALGEALREVIASYPGDKRIGILASGGLSHFQVEEDLDQGVLDAIKRKDLKHLAGLDPNRLKAGSSEIRSWIVAAAAARDLDVSWVAYVPGYRTAGVIGTGLGFVRWS